MSEVTKKASKLAISGLKKINGCPPLLFSDKLKGPRWKQSSYFGQPPTTYSSLKIS
jgi:hypothetical protein